MTEFGLHEWLASAIVDAMQTPIGVNEGEVSVNAFVANYNRVSSYPSKATAHLRER